ncbi:MAG: hypothetical protein SFV54_05440 [Bryobacteraceae bacterium]|nr:hypothetical protein [Bryobacteraceae bacterium]
MAVSFASSIDGFAVIHAAFLAPARRPHFENELKRVGVEKFQVVETRPISDHDPRLQYYKGRANGLLSLIDGFLCALELAENSAWKSVAILEDDIVFRSNFSNLWSEVEDEVQKTHWGVLTPFRWPCGGAVLVAEPLFAKTSLVALQHNLATHCVIVSRDHYSALRESLQHCIARGYPCDFFYGIFSSLFPQRLFATTRNLAGQASLLSSTLQQGQVRGGSRYATYRSANRVEAGLINLAYRPLNSLRKWTRIRV